MMERYYAHLVRLDARLLACAMILLLGTAALAGWSLALRGPYREYQRLKAATAGMAATLRSGADRQAELGRLRATVEQLAKQVDTALAAPSTEAQSAVHVLAAADRLAREHGIAVTAVRPGSGRRTQGLQESYFAVGAQGAYLPLCAWLLDLTAALGPGVVVTNLEMKAAGERREVSLAMKLGIYARAAPAEDGK